MTMPLTQSSTRRSSFPEPGKWLARIEWDCSILSVAHRVLGKQNSDFRPAEPPGEVAVGRAGENWRQDPTGSVLAALGGSRLVQADGCS